MTVKRRRFTQEFKDSAVKLVTEEGYKISEAARNLDVGVSVLRRWKAESEAAQQDVGTTAELKTELSRLKKENHRLKLEREILKKAAAFFAKESGSGIN
jgi:transposase